MTCQANPDCNKPSCAEFDVIYNGEVVYSEKTCEKHTELYAASKHTERIA